MLLTAVTTTPVPLAEVAGSEVLGTALLTLLGCGVVANVTLARTLGNAGGWLLVNFGWGLAVFAGVFAAWRSGAHLNPAVTLGIAASGAGEYAPGVAVTVQASAVYVVAQLVGGFLGAVVCFLAYKKHFDEPVRPAGEPGPAQVDLRGDADTDLGAGRHAAREDGTAAPGTTATRTRPRTSTRTSEQASPKPAPNDDPADAADKLGVFCTGPAIPAPAWNVVTEVVGTFVLVVVVLLIGQTPSGLGPAAVALLVVGIGASLGGPTGYAINPARDLGPRLAHAALPIRGKGGSNWGYAWVPVVGPLLGALLAGLLVRVIT